MPTWGDLKVEVRLPSASNAGLPGEDLKVETRSTCNFKCRVDLASSGVSQSRGQVYPSLPATKVPVVLDMPVVHGTTILYGSTSVHPRKTFLNGIQVRGTHRNYIGMFRNKATHIA